MASEREGREAAPAGRRLLFPGFILFAGVLLFYLALPCRQYNFDGLVFSIFIRHSLHVQPHPDLLHNEHILYGPLGYLLCWPLVRLGFFPDVRAILTLAGSLAGAGACAALFRALRSLGVRDLLALPLALTMALSSTFWLYSTDAEVYIFSALVMLLAVPTCAQLLRDEATPRERVLSGLLPGVALGFHLANVLYLPAFAYCQVAAGLRKGMRALISSLAVAAGAILVPFIAKALLFRANSGILEGFLAVFRRRSDADTSYWGWPDFWLEAKTLLGAALQPVAPGYGVAALLTRAILLLVLLAALWRMPRLLREERRVTVWLWTWLLPYFVFFSVWNVGDVEFTLFQIPPLLLLVGLAARDWAREPRRLWVAAATTWTLALLLGVVNTFSTFMPLADERRNRDLAIARYVLESTRPDDLVVISGRDEEVNLKAYLPYYSGRETLILDFWYNRLQYTNETAEARVMGKLREVSGRGGAIYASSVVLTNHAVQSDFERLHQLPEGYLARLFAALTPGPLAPGPEGFTLYRLTTPPGPR